MSKTSLRSKTSIRSLYRQRKKKNVDEAGKKQYVFCCGIGDYDPLTKYNQRNPPFKSSLPAIRSVHECPVLKVRTQFIEHGVSVSKKKGYKIKTGSLADQSQWIEKNKSTSAPGTLLKFIEDDIELAINKQAYLKQKSFKEEGEKNIIVGARKAKAELVKKKKTPLPRWYQDFSNAQMRQLMVFKEALCADYEEKETYRTQKTLTAIGIISSFFKLAPNQIKTMQQKSNLNPVEFLRETYKIITGVDFETEGHKNDYNCNERLILSAIAFLSLPETIIELNDRLPPIKIPKFPPKPEPPQIVYPRKMDNPYKEKLFEPPNLRLYQLELYTWRRKKEMIPRPKVVLPPKEKSSIYEDAYRKIDTATEEKSDEQSKEIRLRTDEKQSVRPNKKQDKKLVTQNNQKVESNQQVTVYNNNSKNNHEQFDFTLSGLGEGAEPVQYKICGTLDPSERKRKSWLGEKDLHYVISGILNEDEPPQGPVTFELTGLAKVTPSNSNEEFFAKLKLGNGPKKIYPRGRKYLSKNWQEWLQNVDEEFIKIESEANKLIESVEATMRLVVPGPTCDSCCACRQTRKTNLKKHATKTPHMVIESIAEDSDKKRYIVGSLSMHSPAPSLAESTVNLLEVVGSHDKITKNLLINGIINDSGETIYYISGVTKGIEHVPQETIEKIIPKTIKNVPPCACAIENMFNEDLDQESISDDNIPLTKDGLCFGKKYRPKNGPAYTCKQYPGDKSCGRNPFKKVLEENRRKAKMRKTDKDVCPSEERNMFSLPAFQPCGDEDGMAICGGPWGAVNIPDAEELARRKEEEKEILKAPPCGEKPGQSVCEGPWGARVPKPKPPKKVDEDENEDEEEEDEEEEDEKETKILEEKPIETQIVKKKALKRDKLCHMNLDNLKDKSGSPEDDTTDIKIDSNKCGDEDDWNAKRTAPSAKQDQSLYEKGLSLTEREPQSPKTIKKYEKRDKGEKSDFVDKESVRIKNKKDSNQPINSHIRRAMSIPGKSISKKDLQSKRSNSKNKIIRPKSDEEKKESKKNYLKVSEIRNKRSVNSAKKLSSIKTKSKQKNETIKDNNKRKTDISKESKNEFSRGRVSKSSKNNNRFINSSKKLPALKSSKIAKKGEDFPEIVKSTSMNTKSFYNYSKAKLEKLAKKKTSTEVQSKQEKVKQLKEEMKNFKMLPEMEIQPAVIPEEKPKPCKRDIKCREPKCSEMQSLPAKDDQVSRQEGPFGWRTESEQKLAPEKTLIYLTEPTYPMKTVPVRPGGKPCHCRENRNKKKILKYNIGGLLNKVEEKRRKNVQNVTQVIEGLTYVTPPPSPRRSDEYIPEYELYESPYDMCNKQKKDDALKLTERFLGLPSLKPNEPENHSSCGCGYDEITNEIYSSEKKKQLMEKEEAVSNEWTNSLKDAGLIDFFARCRDDVPCWLKCSQFSKTGCCENIRKLQVKKPVCECKYERKIVKRNEEKKNWLDRQERLKSYKKSPFTHVAGISRTMEPDKRFIISGVKKIPKEDGNDEVQYCVSGIAENNRMGPVQYLIDGVNMQTPIVTPKPSEKSIPCVCAHKHWSVTQFPENIASSKKGEVENLQGVKESQDKIGPRRCNDAAKCRELENIRVDYDFKGKGEANAEENKKEEIKTKEKKVVKTKRRRKDNENVIPDSRTVRSRDLSKQTIMQNDLKTSQVQKHVDISDFSQNQTKLKLNQSDSKQLHAKPDSETKKVKKYKADDELDLVQIVTNELNEMAAEGFIFAKLPRCYRVPQIQYWIMYRKGVLFTDKEKEKMIEKSMQTWADLKSTKNRVIEPPSMNLTEQQLAALSFEKAFKLKREIAAKKDVFYSQIRQDRVERSAALWNTMEFGKFPSLSFKEAYFTYLPSKEADGHVLEP